MLHLLLALLLLSNALLDTYNYRFHTKDGVIIPSETSFPSVTSFPSYCEIYLPVDLLVDIDEKAVLMNGKLVEIRHEIFTLDEELV